MRGVYPVGSIMLGHDRWCLIVGGSKDASFDMFLIRFLNLTGSNLNFKLMDIIVLWGPLKPRLIGTTRFEINIYYYRRSFRRKIMFELWLPIDNIRVAI